ncbi:MAG: hypothetical protein JWM18_911 [Chloroflexi bacterium]|jgi:hypothetical protein|nr:hypothetical protein [Chloroflexota bacterium]
MLWGLQATAGNRAVCELLAARSPTVQRGATSSKAAANPRPAPWREKPWSNILNAIGKHDRAESEAIIDYLRSLPEQGEEILARAKREIDREGQQPIERYVYALRESFGLVRPRMPDVGLADLPTLRQALNDEHFFLIFHERLVAKRPTSRGLTFSAFHGGGSCEEIAEHLEAMLPRGIAPAIVHWKGSRSAVLSLVAYVGREQVSLEDMNHAFIRVRLQDHPVIVDAAWRQFVIAYVADRGSGNDRERFKNKVFRDTPRIFVGTFDDLQAVLAEVLGSWKGGGAFKLDDLLAIWRAS